MKLDTRKCSTLKPGENIIILYDCLHNGNRTPIDATVSFVDTETKKVHTTLLLGFRCEYPTLNYEDCLAVYTEDGEYMKFENISGPSQLLIPE